MTRVLVKLVSAVSLDSAKNALLYKRGDVVKVVDDGYYFGDRIEGDRNPKFGIIDLPGVPLAQFLTLIEPETEAVGGEGEVRIVRRRHRRVDLDAMTLAERDDLEGDGRQVEMSEARLAALVEIKAEVS